jgi:hypothetical protein
MLLAVMAGSAFATSIESTSHVLMTPGEIANEKNQNFIPNVPTGENLVGGDNIGSATLIGALPFADGGNTCSYLNDYDEVCPYSGSTSPDVVYSYTPGSNQAVTVDLCASTYDTKVYIYQNVAGNLVACNDDVCGSTTYMSRLVGVNLTGGQTYYIVVDGYFGDCGTYSLSITAAVPCVVTCPPNSQLEGETCFNGYTDNFNGGCNSTPNAFSTVTCNTICGKGGYYTTAGFGYRDTDWYRVTTAGSGVATVTVVAEFPVQLAVLANSCAPITLTCGSSFGADCVPASCTFNCGGTSVIFVSAQQGLTLTVCDLDYRLTIEGCGVPGCAPSATENTTWGNVKGLYRN